MISKETSRRVRQKSGVDRSLSRIRTGIDLAENSVDARILGSHATNDALRAIESLHQKTNSTGARILASHDTDDALRAVMSLHQRTNSTDSRVLASHVTDDALRAITRDHQKANSTDSRILQSHATDDALRAVTNTHMRSSIVDRRVANLTDLYVALDARYIQHGETAHGSVHVLTAPALIFAAFMFSQTNVMMAWALLTFTCLLLTAQLFLSNRK